MLLSQHGPISRRDRLQSRRWRAQVETSELAIR